MIGNQHPRVLGRALLWLAVVAGTILATPSAAAAHAVLVSSSPAPSSTLTTVPDTVLLTFDEPLAPSLSHAAVVDPAGRRFIATVSGSRMRVRLDSGTAGVYHVSWTTVSEVDGHTINGEFAFGVGVTVTPDARGGVRGAGVGDIVVAVLRGLEYACLLLACGLVTLRRVVAGRAAVREAATPVSMALLASALAVVIAEASLAAGHLSTRAIADYLAIGATGPARLVALLCAAGLAGTALRRRALYGPLVGGVVIALSAAGHAANVEPPWLGIAVNAGHVAASGIWAGGILALALQRLAGDWATAGNVLLARFARVAPWAFGASVTLGVVQATELVGYWTGLVATGYGRTLLLKAVAVAAMTGLSVMAVRRRAMVRAEAALALVVVLVAALLTASPVVPKEAREAATASPASPSAPQAAPVFPRAGDLTLAGRAGNTLVALTLRPGRPGPNELYAYVAGVAPDTAVRASIAETVRDMTSCGASCWSTPVELAGGERVAIQIARRAAVTFTLPSLPAPDGSALVASAATWLSGLKSYRVQETFSGIRSTYVFAVPHRMWLRMWLSGSPRDSLWLGTSLYKRKSPTAPWSAPVTTQPVPVPYVAWKPFQPAVDATVIGTGSLDGVPVREVSFFGGHGSDPEPVWFTLWIDAGGRVLRSEMWAPSHFMDDRYSAFNEPVSLPQPPGI